MATYGQMQTRIADELSRSDLTTHIQYAIKDAIKAYEAQKFFFNELYRQTATVSTGESSISLPTNVAKIDKMQIRRNTSNDDWLTHRDLDTILQLQSPLIQSQPTEFAIYNDRILFDCESDQVYPLYITGVQKFTELSASGDTNAWTTQAEELIRLRAKAIVYADVIMDQALATWNHQRERLAFDYLCQQGIVRGSGRVRPTYF